jgi:SAM-dependent methyltransferase
MLDSPRAFYDALAPHYHLIFADWKRSVARQAGALDRLIRDRQGPPPLSVLDCSCGIGTQAIGLARLGYRVHGTDLSPRAVERAAREAAGLGAAATFAVADFRMLDVQVPGTFDVVLSCDNALPHLLTEADLDRAARAMAAKLTRGGLLLISLRDYDDLLRQKPRATLPDVHEGPDGRRVVFQVWDWRDDSPAYRVHYFILRDADGAWQTFQRSMEYRALLRNELSAILTRAGFTGVHWHRPEETGYYQPVVTAIRGG